MDRFRELIVFASVAKECAFNAAARKLNMSPPAVTRAITALEERLGVSLFTRTTRQVALTEAGVRLREDAGQILAALEDAEQSARGAHSVPVGELRLTAPVLFGQSFIAPILRDFLDRHQGMRATAQFLDRNVDLIEEGFDVAVRIGQLADSGLTARKIGDVRLVVVAAPSYLKLHGAPVTPAALTSHTIILPTAANTRSKWRFHMGAKQTEIELEPRLRVNTMAAAIDAALAGWGVTRVLSYQVSDDLRHGRLIDLSAQWDDGLLPVHMVHSEGRRAAAKIRHFVDFAAQSMRKQAEYMLGR